MLINRYHSFSFFVLILPVVKCYASDFKIYTFIPWKQVESHGHVFELSNLDKYLATNYGTLPTKVVYPKQMFTQNNLPDYNKIKNIADFAILNPEYLVSFDIEIGDKNQPSTILPTVNKTLDIFHKYNQSSLVGVYGILPQNTAGGKFNANKYRSLNYNYSSIATKVSVFSPVLYNYNGKDFELWKKSVDFAIAESKKYKINQKIIPYISPIYWTERNGGKINRYKVQQLSEQDMYDRLNYLKAQGTDGVIVWASSQYIQLDNTKPIFQIDKGWGKAMLNFANNK